MENIDTIQETDCQKALRMLKDIPESKWQTKFYSSESDKKCCAVGHLCRMTNNPDDFSVTNCSPEDKQESMWALKLRQKIYDHKGCELDIYVINDEKTERYQQASPKQRVVQLLTDMIKIGL